MSIREITVKSVPLDCVFDLMIKVTLMQVFVFGSNLAGRHGKGSALEAYNNHGAIYGCGAGPQGQSYAIPTKDYDLSVLSLPTIKSHVTRFLAFARNNPQHTFNVVRIGCGLAGYKDHQIAPFFANAPDNVNLPVEWLDLV